MENEFRSQDETLDTLSLYGIKVIQKKEGYRFSLDAILLAHFAVVKKGDRIMELGTGSGVIPLILAKRSQAGEIYGIEIQADLARMAIRSVELNHLADRIKIIQRDLRELKEAYEAESFDLILSNPPYRKIRSGRVNPSQEKAIARHEIRASLQDVLEATSYLVKNRGRVALIYPASRLIDLVFQLRMHKLEPKMIQTIYPNRASKGNLVIVEAIKGGKTEVKIMEPLFVYDENGDYTKEMKRVLALT